MGIKYHIDKEQGLALVLWERVVTAEEFLAHVTTALTRATPSRGARTSQGSVQGVRVWVRKGVPGAAREQVGGDAGRIS
jgi:hypothetical protein